METPVQRKSFPCPECDKSFTDRHNRNRHVRQHHQHINTHICPKCSQGFSRKDKFVLHLKTHETKSQTNKRKHSLGDEPSKKKIKSTSGRNQLEAEAMELEQSPLSTVHKEVPDENPTFVDEEIEEGPEIQALLAANKSAIETKRCRGRHQTTYTIRWPAVDTPPDWETTLRQMYEEQEKRFKINYSHHFVLRHRETGELRFFHACENNATVMDQPMTINHFSDFLFFLKTLENQDVLEFCRQQRPSTKWMVHSIPATTFYVNPLLDFPIGCPDPEIPKPVKSSNAIYTVTHDQQRNAYNDNLCFFRCLALHQNKGSFDEIKIKTLTLFDVWCPGGDPAAFLGVKMKDLGEMEKIFAVNIDVFEWNVDNNCLVPMRRSKGDHPDNLMRLLMVNDHFCFIKDINNATKGFECDKCGKVWRKLFNLERHYDNCNGTGIREKYPGGVYHPTPTVLELLDANGINVDTKYVYPYRATFDIESYYDYSQTSSTDKTEITAVHQLMSVSVASNVPGFEKSKCFISNGNPQAIVNDMIDYLESVADEAYRRTREEFEDVFDELEARRQQEEEEEERTTSKLDGTDATKRLTDLSAVKLMESLENYLHELIVVGFNSGKYDLQVLKPYLIQRLVVSTEGGLKFVVKKNNNFMALSTQKLKFVDIRNFIAPGFTYEKYLAAYKVEEKKGFFPYEYMDGLHRLDETSLPPQVAFFSKLKGEGISDEDYSFCQKVWEENNMTTMRDFLIWYNDKDVEPFLKALEKQISFYKTLNLDMLKDAISIPGLTLRYLFKTLPPTVYFSLVGEYDQDLHQLMREQMVGGPSLIFCRYHEKGKTCIRGNPDKPVQTVIGYDSNALYLWAIMQPTPTGHPIRRRKENHFRPEVVDKYGRMAHEWLEYTAHVNCTPLVHKFNGKEHSLGRRHLRVDGWDARNQIVYQFMGCVFHGHQCHLTRNHTQLFGKNLESRRAETTANTAYLRNQVGVTVVEKWECEWQMEKRTNPAIQQFLATRFPHKRAFQRRRFISQQDILYAVRNETFFGLVQCDIHVPDHLKDHFSEMQPIFKNTTVGRDDIGEHMRAYAQQHKLLSQPRRTLIGSFFGKAILLTSPLLKWYLEHGLVVTDIQQIIEYEPSDCFKMFGETVSDARRQGKADKSKTILAETMKLLGNSAYGKTLTNLAKHRDVKYPKTEKETSKLINNPRYRKLTEINGKINEIESAKSTIKWNLPIQIGYFVYQYAKLRMLQFHYDCLDTFVSRADYQLCEMDTDSAYMALSADTMDAVIKPEMRKTFYQQMHHWFPSPACDNHRGDFLETCLKKNTWTPPPCCQARLTFDERTPGLFKTEYQGGGIVALCSKTYYCFGGEKDDKFSCKGLNKTTNQLSENRYLNVLETQTSGAGLNRGFKCDGKRMLTYTQERHSLSYLYIKRKVDTDGINTHPIDI